MGRTRVGHLPIGQVHPRKILASGNIEAIKHDVVTRVDRFIADIEETAQDMAPGDRMDLMGSVLTLQSMVHPHFDYRSKNDIRQVALVVYDIGEWAEHKANSNMFSDNATTLFKAVAEKANENGDYLKRYYERQTKAYSLATNGDSFNYGNSMVDNEVTTIYDSDSDDDDDIVMTHSVSKRAKLTSAEENVKHRDTTYPDFL